MNENDILSNIRSRICSSIKFIKEGMDRNIIITPFTFNDGDALKIVLKGMETNSPIITDEGHTLMHLSYNDLDIDTGTRSAIMTNVLSRYSITNDDGELLVRINDLDEIGDHLYSFIQGLINITDLDYLKREHVRTTFYDDVKAIISESFSDSNIKYDHIIESHDHQGLYTIDCMIKIHDRDIFIFSILNDDKCRDATISLLQFEKFGIDFSSIGIFQNQEGINRKVLSRFTDVCEKQFSTLDSAKDRISKYIEARA